VRVYQFRHIRADRHCSRDAYHVSAVRRGLVLVLFVGAAWAAPAAASSDPVEVVVTLEQPSLARAIEDSRALSAATKRRRLSLLSPTSVAYLRHVDGAQDALAARIERRIPGARVRWRYRIVLNGLAVVVPAGRLTRLASLPGVAGVAPAVGYGAALDSSPREIGAPALWNSSLASTGEGMKIAVLDDGVDQTHPFFAPAGYTMPAGFPRGNAAFTTTKVIVAKAFAPPSPRWRHAATPFDPELSGHGTHVAGIAAGNAGVVPNGRRNPVSGVAPRAYIGNYKVLTVPTDSGVGLNGNSPEIAAGIEEAVKDGMDVINLSLGEPEIEPTRDIVALAIDAAAEAGVVVTVAAGNDGSRFGGGSISSPATAAGGIAVAAASSTTEIAGFSSIGPTPVSLRLKPDVSAPGVDILSSVPPDDGLWASFSGTSMAAPHIAGGAALLLQRHPTWTPAQVKSALVQTASPLDSSPTRAGAGLAHLARADDPLLFAEPASLSFGLVPRSGTASPAIGLTDAGGGTGEWLVAVDSPGDTSIRLEAPPAVTVPGTLRLGLTVGPEARDAAHTGFVTLTRGDAVRRIPYWFRVTARALSRHRTTPLRRPGVYRGNTAGRPALVSDYRYPERGSHLPGPEQVFRVTIARPVANFGVVLVSRGRGVRVEARVTFAGDENRLVGYTALPLNLNPYMETFMSGRLVSGAVLPVPGAYDVVFDSPGRTDAGRFTFRFWVNDVTPPRLRLLDRSVRRGRPVRVAASDAGSGIDPVSMDASIDGRSRTVTISRGVVRVDTTGLARGRHRLLLQVSDYQETRNMENVTRILPNTRRIEAVIRVVR
jgi:subtilisin family serine protease